MLELIDFIWRASENKIVTAREAAKKMTSRDWLVLASWDVAASFGPVNGTISLGLSEEFTIADELERPWLSASVVRVTEHSIPRSSILYDQNSYCVVIKEAFHTIPRDQFRHDAAKLLLVMQFVRYHLDSILLKSAEFRQSELSSFADFAGLEDQYFRSLIRWYPRVEALL